MKPTIELKVTETEKEIIVSNKNIEVVFNNAKGTISKYEIDGTEYFKKGPEPNFWRATTDNDFGNGMHKRCVAWRTAGTNRKTIGYTLDNFEKIEIQIEFIIELPDVGSKQYITYNVFGDGTIRVQNKFLSL